MDRDKSKSNSRVDIEDMEMKKYIGKTNIPDYGVPSGVQLTENLNEEIAEAASKLTLEMPPEK